ncbi:MAG TPA: cell division protein FtsW [Flavobacteriales bacterium]|jgi:cell division protein FtsW|nr:cell division protein FtsW [Flavobacteriales bacterium]HIB77776.1 cell division protein FtsW [Flavobacteriales bacterium]HIN41310.1 cell division protein FtsW [Flavobacteriales bacterium]HIO15511.1 cell division protein FtsW [Flavobacteriales bacterium]
MSNWAQIIREKIEGDKIIWMVVLILSVWSILSVYGSISSLAYKAQGNSLRFLMKQAGLLIGGLGIMYAIHKVHYKYFARLANVLLVFSIIALILTLVFGADINEARRWLKLPFIGLTLQTSDFAKVAIVVWLAKELHVRRDRLNDFKGEVIPMLIRIGIVCGLILPADFSTAALLVIVCISMLYIGGVPFKGLFSILGLLIAFGFTIYGVSKAAPNLVPRSQTWVNRIDQFVGENVGSGISGSSDYQIDLAQVAINRGGLLPSGPGTGTSRNFLPHPYSDMIYAFIIEEWGSIIGGFGLLLMYFILLYRTIHAARNCNRPFGSFLAMGLGLLITIQALINMGVAVRLFPTTGQPLPLVSFGGTSLIFTFISIGMILAVSRSPILSKNN